MNPETILELQNISVYRDETLALNHISLKVQNGQHTVILGPNGSGKSTLLKIFTQELFPIQNPNATVKHFNRCNWATNELQQNIGIVSTDLQYQYSPDATCIEVILSGFYGSIGVWPHQEYTSTQQQKAQGLLTSLGLANLSKQTFSSLSTGQQRRLLLGRALIHNPKLLILDEPSNGLDIKASWQYVSWLNELNKNNKTFVLVTHHLHEIPPEFNQVILLKQGKIFAQGLKANVLTDQNLSLLFDMPLKAVQHQGYYQVLPR